MGKRVDQSVPMSEDISGNSTNDMRNGVDEGEDGSRLGLGGPAIEMGDLGGNHDALEEFLNLSFWSGLRSGNLYVPRESRSNDNRGSVNAHLNGNGNEVEMADVLQVCNDLGSSHGPCNSKGVMDLNLQLGLSDGTSSSSARVVSGVTEGLGSGRLLRRLGLGLGGPLGLSDGASSSSAPVVSGVTEGLGSGRLLRRLGLGLGGPPIEMVGCDGVENEELINVSSGGNENESEDNADSFFVFSDFELCKFGGLIHVNMEENENGREVEAGALPVFEESSAADRGSCEHSSSFPQVVSSAADRESGDHDMQNKRLKVHKFSILKSSGENAESSDSPMCEIDSIDNMLASGNSTDTVETHGVSMQAKDTVQRDLTDDLLYKVFSLLDPVDICRASVVCRQWRAAGSQEDLWRNFTFENKPITRQQFGDMCHRYPNVVSVKLSDVPHMDLLAVTAVSMLSNLEVLILSKGILLNSFFQAMTGCPTLKNLTINNANLGNDIFGTHQTIHHAGLCFLHVVDCRISYLSIRCPKLITLSLRLTNMSNVMLNTPLLRHLDIDHCGNFISDSSIRAAVTSCPLLESLAMKYSCAENDTLREIARVCGNLRVLNVSNCQNISLESVRLPMLTALTLHSCDSVTSASIAGLSHSYALETLEIGHCRSLTSLALDLPCLQNVRIDQCPKLVDLTLQSSMLSSINVSDCPLQRVDITSRKLRKLVLQKQEALTTLNLLCECLQEVDLNGCEALTDSICEVFSYGGGCPMLKSLILDNCQSLTTASFCTSSLVHLSLANCRAITSLLLNCPLLERLAFDGCNNLEKASFFPVGLKFLNLGICPKLQELRIKAPQLASLVMLGCGRLSETSIYCPQLKSLDASFCSQLKDDFLSEMTSSFPLIETLILTSCFCVGSDGRISLQRLERLTYLDLSYTYLEDLQPVFKSCMHLKVLKLQACKYLADWSLAPLYKEGALPALSELDLSYCTFSQLAIEGVLSCTHLTHVSLSGCVNLRDLNWDFQRDRQVPEIPSAGLSSDTVSVEDIQMPDQQSAYMLQQLNCIGCPNIKKIVIPSTTRCLNLSSVNLSLSVYLKEVNVACSNLFSLNLSNCGSLKILKLKCPRLSSLNLQSCNIAEEAVIEAISSCSMLETLDVRICPKIYPTCLGKLRDACPSLKRICSSVASSS